LGLKVPFQISSTVIDFWATPEKLTKSSNSKNFFIKNACKDFDLPK